MITVFRGARRQHQESLENAGKAELIAAEKSHAAQQKRIADEAESISPEVQLQLETVQSLIDEGNTHLSAVIKTKNFVEVQATNSLITSGSTNLKDGQ